MNYKRFSDITIIAFITSGIVFLVGINSWLSKFYNPLFFGLISFLCAFIIYLPKIIFKAEEENKLKVRTELQAVISIGLLLNGFGELSLFELYRAGFQYDKFIHFTVAILMTIVAVRFFMVWIKTNFKKSLAIGGLVVFAGGIVWEILEFASDLFLNTKIWGVDGNYAWPDTIGDISFNIGGIIVGIFVLNFLNRKNNNHAI